MRHARRYTTFTRVALYTVHSLCGLNVLVVQPDGDPFYCVFIQVAKKPDPKFEGVNMARIEVVQAEATDGKIYLVDEAKAPVSYSCCGS